MSKSIPWLDEQYYGGRRNLGPGDQRTCRDESLFRQALAFALRASPESRLTELGGRLGHCKPNDRCNSGACPECETAASRFAIRSFLGLREAADQPLAAFEVRIKADADGKYGDFGVEDLVNAKRLAKQFSEILKEAGQEKTPLVAGLNLPYEIIRTPGSNPDVDVRRSIQWVGFARCRDLKAFRSALRKRHNTVVHAERYSVNKDREWFLFRLAASIEGLEPMQALALGESLVALSLTTFDLLSRIELRDRVYEQNTGIFSNL